MNLLPPEPPKETETLNGTFKYLKSKGDQIMYSTAYKAITMTETWDYIMNMETIFGPESNRIYKKIEELGYQGHSGCSFMCTLRDMQYIVKYGEKKFKDTYDTYEKRASSDPKIKERRRIIAELENETKS